jgi:ubiquinone biosynthesis protein UbiJ
MTDCEYFERQLDAAYAEYEQWQVAVRQARSPERIKYCQEEIDTIQKRIDRLCDKLDRIKRDNRQEGCENV